MKNFRALASNSISQRLPNIRLLQPYKDQFDRALLSVALNIAEAPPNLRVATAAGSTRSLSVPFERFRRS
jgi:hypothetical protein